MYENESLNFVLDIAYTEERNIETETSGGAFQGAGLMRLGFSSSLCILFRRSATMANQQTAPAENSDQPWVVSLDVNKLMAEHEAKPKTTRRLYPSVSRVPPFIRNLKKEIYNPSFLPMGLYNRDFRKLTAVDNLKLEVLTCMLPQLKVNQDNWQAFCKEVATQPEGSLTPDVDYFYEDDGSYSALTLESKQSILVIDAFFITALFLWRVEPKRNGTDLEDGRPQFLWDITKIFYRGSVESSLDTLERDIFWVFECQIPLFLIRNLWDRIASSGMKIKEFDFMLRYFVDRTLEFSGLVFKDPFKGKMSYKTCDHLLQCVHRSLSYWPCSVYDEEEQEEAENDGGEEKEEAVNVEVENSEDQKGEGSSGAEKIEEEVNAKVEVENAEDDREDNDKDEDEVNEEKGGFTSRIRKLLTVSLFLNFAGKVINFVTGLLSPGEDKPRRRFPSAVELAKRGIRFRGVDGPFDNVHFEKSFFRLSATLKLPKIDVTDFTEKMLLNMCVYEIMTRKANGVHDYLLLMDELINSKEDVDLLMEGENPVITLLGQGDSQRGAQIFSNMLQNFSFATFNVPILYARIAILDWYGKRRRRRVVEFIDRFRLRACLLVSLLAGTFLLVLIVLQTIYTIWGFYKG
ncbi:hypothetical protein R1sor_006957 [Riccia sorocarpa]|uniref:Uncharacterized protein n=1 Tax=Riccia sorocarpa TaxID=122646 RepID=A0ABD3HR84_9MARC